MQKTCCWISANITSQWSPHVTNCGCHHVINAPLDTSLRLLFETMCCSQPAGVTFHASHSIRVWSLWNTTWNQSFTGTAPWLLRLGHSAWMHLQWWCICLPDSNEKLHHKHPKAPKSTRKLENDVCSNAHGNTDCNLRKISEKSHACITGGSTKQHYSVVSHKGCGVTKSGAGSNQQTDLKLERKSHLKPFLLSEILLIETHPLCLVIKIIKPIYRISSHISSLVYS